MGWAVRLSAAREKAECFFIAIWRGPLRRQPQPQDIDILVVSPGGVGTTSLIKHLRTYCRVNWSDDSDWLKHLPRPPKPPLRTIFVYGDAEAIFASIDRRDWIDIQAAKLGSPSAVLLWGQAKRRAFLRCVARQEQAWRRAPDTLFVRYDDLWDSAALIRDFAGITDASFVARFPKRQDRLSAVPAAATGQRLPKAVR